MQQDITHPRVEPKHICMVLVPGVRARQHLTSGGAHLVKVTKQMSREADAVRFMQNEAK
jgi:hypothetical protein